MFAVLFDKSFKSLGSKTTYQANRWSLTRRAYEMDSFSVSSQQIERSANAAFVGLFEQKGRLKYLAFAGRPKDSNGMTEVNGMDLRRVFMQNVKIAYSLYQNASVAMWVGYLLALPKTDIGASWLGLDYSVDVTEISAASPSWVANSIAHDDAIGNVWEELQAAMMRYGFTIEAEANITTDGSTGLQYGTVTFKAKMLSRTHQIKLADFDAPRVMNDSTDANRAIALAKSSSSVAEYWIVTRTSDNEDVVMAKSDAETAVANGDAVLRYPARTETFVEEDFAAAQEKAMNLLEKNRFKGSVTLSADTVRGKTLKGVTLHDWGNIYGYNAADDSTYKKLPVYSIKEGSDGKTSVTFGRLDDYYYI